jgi:predicted Zn-dependent peptidase
MTPVNLKREKMVVCEEIKESTENPSDNIHDIFAEAYWGNHPLGRPIMGSMQSIVDMPRRRLLDYIKSNYRSESIVIAASGSISHDRLVKLVRKHFDFLSGRPAPASEATRKGQTRVKVVPDKNKQAHLSLGFPGLGYRDKDRMAALVLNSYLGGGMSSVLFQKIREERGLAYSVYTFLDFYREAGIFGAYLGSDVNQLGKAVNIILAETGRLKKRKLPELRLNQVKQQLKGQITLGMESTSSRMNRLARQELVLDRYISLNETLKEIDSVTASDVIALANKLFDRSQLTVAVRGPAKNGFLDDVLTG